MKKAMSLIAVSGFFLTASVGFPNLANAQHQPTQSGIRTGAEKTIEAGQEGWQNLSPEQQQQFREKRQEAGQKAGAAWRSLSPEQQQEVRGNVTTGAQNMRRKWHSLPE